jgi:hypothetical protein
MTDEGTFWARAQLWLPATLGWGFAAKCVLLRLAIVLPPVALLMQRGYGVAGLVALVLLSWPWPFRLNASDDGLRVRYAFVETLVPIGAIERVCLERDPRRGVLGRRETVLRVARRCASPVMVLAPLETLQRLHRGLEDRLRA